MSIRPNRSASPRSDAGFALPSAIFALVVVAFLITTGIQMATLESRIGVSTDRATRAFYVAESGMNTALAEWTPAQANLAIWGDPVTVSGTAEGGKWEVEVRRVADRMYYMRSSGGVPTTGGSEARRVLGVMTKVTSLDLNPPAALLTRGQVRVAGSAQVRGEDRVPDGWGAFCPDPLQDFPGIVVDLEGKVETDGQGTVTGVPGPWQQDASVTPESFTNFGDMSYDDLAALANIRFSGTLTVNNTEANPNDGTGPCNTGDRFNWGDPDRPGTPCGAYFPIIHFSGADAKVRIQSNGNGQGIILVDGDLDLRGNFLFHGLIIVRGRFEVQGGGPRIFGAVMAENAELEPEALVGASIIQNSRCALNRAIRNNAALNRLRPLGERSWVDLTGVSF